MSNIQRNLASEFEDEARAEHIRNFHSLYQQHEAQLDIAEYHLLQLKEAIETLSNDEAKSFIVDFVEETIQDQKQILNRVEQKMNEFKKENIKDWKSMEIKDFIDYIFTTEKFELSRFRPSLAFDSHTTQKN